MALKATMDRQDELLHNEDGRYYAIDRFNTGLAAVDTTERIGKNLVSFGLPSGPALFLPLAHRAYSDIKSTEPMSLFDSHDQGMWPDDQGPLFDFLEASISHIVFSFTAIEAFAIEAIPSDYTYKAVEAGGEQKTYNKEEIERRTSLDYKLDSILPQICSISSPKGIQVWEKYKQVKKARNRIIHLETADRTATGPDTETIWGDILKMHQKPFCDYAYQIIGYYKPAVDNRRWYKNYPYVRPAGQSAKCES